MDHSTLFPLSVSCLLFLLPPPSAQFMTECERGVRRPHPSQENAYQIFVRSERGVRWLDQSCPAPNVFQPQSCACQPPDLDLDPAPSTVVPPFVRKSPWFSKSKALKKKKLQREGKGSKPRQRKRPAPRFPPPPTPPPPPPPPPQVSDRQGDSNALWEVKKKRPFLGNECFHLRAVEADDSQYEQWTESGWVQMNCNWPVNSGLIWIQELCRCDWGPNRHIASPNLNSVPAVCLMMLKLNFEGGEVKDVGRDLWLDFHHPEEMEALRDETAVGGWAGAFRGAGISVPFFKMNTLGATFRIKFQFRLCDGQPDADLMLINNGCLESDALPSLQVSYRAWTKVLAFQMATANTLGPIREECHVTSQEPWVDVNIHYDDDLLEIFVNDMKCVRSAAYTGPIVETDCPFTLLEDNFCGLLDEVVITRGCTPMQES